MLLSVAEGRYYSFYLPSATDVDTHILGTLCCNLCPQHVQPTPPRRLVMDVTGLLLMVML